jgi:hypothetical protein
MFVSPGDFAHRLSREAAQSVASNWWRFLLNGVLLIVAGGSFPIRAAASRVPRESGLSGVRLSRATARRATRLRGR